MPMRLAVAHAGLRVLGEGKFEGAVIPAGAALFTREEALKDGTPFVAVYARAGADVYAVSDAFPEHLDSELDRLTGR